jgi:hypothetical protein
MADRHSASQNEVLATFDALRGEVIDYDDQDGPAFSGTTDAPSH